MTLLPPELSILDEQIASGWGDTPGVDIPADWRSRRGPGITLTPEQKQTQSEGKKKAWRRVGGWGGWRARQRQKTGTY